MEWDTQVEMNWLHIRGPDSEIGVFTRRDRTGVMLLVHLERRRGVGGVVAQGAVEESLFHEAGGTRFLTRLYEMSSGKEDETQ